MTTCSCFTPTFPRWSPPLKEPGPSAPPSSGRCAFGGGGGVNGMPRVKVAELFFITLNSSTTITGKFWLAVTVLLRAPVLLLAGYPLYADEQERFVCNTVQPGCASVCFDAFSPLSLVRFWLFQLIAQCLPYALFISYVVHEETSELTALYEIKAELAYSTRQESPASGQLSHRVSTVSGVKVRRYTIAYFLHLLLRILLEAGFGMAQFHLFGSHVPRRILCDEAPCTTTVDCYVSRPSEKTALLQFTLGVSAFSLLLNVADLISIARQSVSRVRRKRMLVRKMYEEECYVSAGGEGLDPHLPLSLGVSATLCQRRPSESGTDDLANTCQEEAEPFNFPGEPRSRGPGVPDGQLQAREEEEDLQRAGSQVCLASPVGTPRPVVVCKRTRIRPPPPPRRDSSAKSLCTKRVGQYTLVEVSAPNVKSDNTDLSDKRSAWV